MKNELSKDKDVTNMSDVELESAWQLSADMIGQYAMKSWHESPEGEQFWRDKATAMQDRQSVIQKEITKRHA